MEGRAFRAAACAGAAVGGRLGLATRRGPPLSGMVAAGLSASAACAGAAAAGSLLCVFSGQRGINLSATAWWRRLFRSRLRLAAGSRHYSGRHFCWSALPGRRELRNAAVPPARRWPGSPGEGSRAEPATLPSSVCYVCGSWCCLPLLCRYTLSLFLNGISQGDLARYRRPLSTGG